MNALRAVRFMLVLCAGLALLPTTAVAADMTAQPGESFRRFTHDGAWCWFSDPRALHTAGEDGRTYAAWVNSQGDVAVGAYDGSTDPVQTTIVHRKLEADDHVNPSLVVLPDGRLRVFYAKHADKVMRTRVTEQPGDISAWKPEQELALNNADEQKPDHPNAICYSNPVLLANGDLWLFWRGMNYKPCGAVSHDGGATFERGHVLFAAAGAAANNRPYLKVGGDDGKTVHFAVTTGHPRDEAQNSVYYCSFDGRTFRRADGSVIGTTDDLPIDPAKCDVVHNGPELGVRAWIWDVAADAQGRPVLAYTQLPTESQHVYCYARWDGRKWQTARVADAGGWFPQTPEGKGEREPHYSGGLALDHADPSRVYLARPEHGVFEIERWVTTDGGTSWTHTPVTQGSQYSNVRPVAIRNAPAAGPHVLWMCIDRHYVHYTRYAGSIRMDVVEPPRGGNTRDPQTIQQLMERVGRWQLANPAGHALTDWTQGALYAGMMALVRTSQDPAFEQAMLDIGQATGWKLGPRPFFADDQCVGQMYAEMYMRRHDPAMIAPLRAVMDGVVAEPPPQSLAFTDNAYMNYWVWCDALFMAPPSLARLYEATGDERYRTTLNERWWATTDYLYDRSEHLYFRDSRYFDKREANGAKVFWSRGNGWVLAGTARVLQSLPAGAAERPRYEQLFIEMSARIAELQQPDGLWHSSLLDPASYPHAETSGSGFYCFGLAWGVNNGLLERAKYQPVIERAWTGLVRCVDANGMLEWVQPIGQDPRSVCAAHTDVFGVGAFLLAGEQVRLLMESPLK